MATHLILPWTFARSPHIWWEHICFPVDFPNKTNPEKMHLIFDILFPWVHQVHQQTFKRTLRYQFCCILPPLSQHSEFWSWTVWHSSTRGRQLGDKTWPVFSAWHSQNPKEVLRGWVFIFKSPHVWMSVGTSSTINLGLSENKGTPRSNGLSHMEVAGPMGRHIKNGIPKLVTPSWKTARFDKNIHCRTWDKNS